MKSLLVALIVHLLNDPASFMAGNVPFYVVPAQMFAVDAATPLKLTTSPEFGPAETRRWKATIAVAGSVKNAAELCYTSAYSDFRRGVTAMPKAEGDAFLVEVGGHHALARVAVAWCNVSIRELDIIPLLKHPELAAVEQNVRMRGYVDDVAFVDACKDEACKTAALQSFGKGLVGIPLEAHR